MAVPCGSPVHPQCGHSALGRQRGSGMLVQSCLVPIQEPQMSPPAWGGGAREVGAGVITANPFVRVSGAPDVWEDSQRLWRGRGGDSWHVALGRGHGDKGKRKGIVMGSSGTKQRRLSPVCRRDRAEPLLKHHPCSKFFTLPNRSISNYHVSHS